jgi:hypothetical protein
VTPRDPRALSSALSRHHPTIEQRSLLISCKPHLISRLALHLALAFAHMPKTTRPLPNTQWTGTGLRRKAMPPLPVRPVLLMETALAPARKEYGDPAGSRQAHADPAPTSRPLPCRLWILPRHAPQRGPLQHHRARLSFLRRRKRRLRRQIRRRCRIIRQTPPPQRCPKTLLHQ